MKAKLLCFFMLVLGVAQARVVTFTPESMGDGELAVMLDDMIMMELSDGFCTSDMLTLRNGGATLSFSSNDEPITGIRIIVVPGDPADRISGNGYVASGEIGTWTGAALDVTLVNNSYDWVGIKKIVVCTNGSDWEDEGEDNENPPLGDEGKYVFDCGGTIDGTDSLVVDTEVATFIQRKANGQNKPAYVNPWRIYTNNTVTIRMKDGYALKGVRILVANGYEDPELEYSEMVTESFADGCKTILNLPENLSSFTIANKGSQTRWQQIEITYVKGMTDATVVISPRAIDFGTISTGNKNSRNITVFAQKPTSITGVSISEPFSVSDFIPPVLLEESESYTLSLDILSQTKDSFEDTLRIAFTDTVCKVPVKATVVDGMFGASEGAFPSSLGYLYDVNGDGRMEYFVNAYPNVEQYTFDGLLMRTIPTGNYLFSLDDMNNDGILDIVCDQSGDKEDPGFVSVHSLDGTLQNSFPVALNSKTYTVMLDANSDGRSDFFMQVVDDTYRVGSSYYNVYKNFIYYQQPDGSFMSKEIRVLDDPSEIENAMFAQYGANAIVIQPVNFSGVSLAKSPSVPWRAGAAAENTIMHKTRSAELFYGNTSPIAVDVNMDGYPDLLNLNNGDALLSIGDGTYYYGSFEGQTTVKDLNGDGMPDFVLYDEGSRTVTLYIYEGNNRFMKQTLMQNFNITGIYTFDFDHDGDVDILLPFDYTEDSQYAYLVFFENQGDNIFKKRERSFDYGRALSFIGGGDVDNDGRFEVVAREDKNIFLIDCETNFEIGAESGVIATVPDPKSYEYRGDYHFVFGDFDNDGRTEWWSGVNFNSDWNNSGAAPYGDRKLGRFDADKLNTAPQKMSAPSYIYDAAINMLRVEWKTGKDAENSSCDLTYALRIGTEPGKGDVWYAYADANGRRLRPGHGNAGYNTYALVSTAGWSKGTYYMAVQAIDANGLGGAWSDEITFEYKGLTASFLTSADNINIMDTLIVSTTSDFDDNCTYSWNWGDGGREVKREGNRWMVVYDRAGHKTISLTVTDSDGLIAVSDEVTVDVFPLQWKEDLIPDGGSRYSSYSSSGRYFDIDMNGSLDLVGNAVISSEQSLSGVFSNEQNNNRFKKVGRTYNSDLVPDVSVDVKIIPIDFNMDGIPDFMGNTNKGNLFVNEGSFDFTYSTETYTVPPKEDIYDYPLSESELYDINARFDFNNDGYLDAVYRGRIGINKGDNLSFEKYSLPEPADGWQNEYPEWIDFNRDGYMDFWWRETDTDVWSVKRDVLYLNNGDGTFERKIIREYPYREAPDNLCFFDLNNDGWQDMIWSIMPELEGSVLETGSTHIILGDASMSYVGKEEIILEGYAFSGNQYERLYDLDNNGWLDLPVTVADGFTVNIHGTTFLRTAIGMLYLYPDWKTVFEKGALSPVDEMPFADLNGDGLPDGNDKLMVTKLTNAAPEAPKNVRAVQTEDGVLLQWDDAHDAETPAVHMRYNISLKRKGASGKDSYVLSPMNGGNDVAAAIPGYLGYRTCPRMVMPTRRFEVGQEYELKVQAIDLWNEHSSFSETFTFRMESMVSIDAPAETCTERVVTVTYKGTESGTPQWSAGDGGEVFEADGNSVDMLWKTPGLKTIKVTIGGVVSERSIMVNETPDLSVDFPETILIKAAVRFNLPDVFVDPSKLTYIRGSFYHNGQKDLPIGSYIKDSDLVTGTGGIFALAKKTDSTEARLALLEAGRYWMDFYYEDPVCGPVNSRVWFDVVDVQPEIAIVGVDGSKNVVQWNVEAAQASGVNFETVRIYKETGSTNNFVLIGESELSDGYYVDLSSDPTVRKSRYAIDMCTADGMVSGRSEVHGSVHVMLNKGVTPNSVNIVWTPYEGGIVDQYTILRGTSPDALEVLATASGYETSYTDQTKPDGDVYYALQYTNLYSNTWGQKETVQKLRSAAKVQSLFDGRSNVVNANSSVSITMAESLYVMVLGNSESLTPEQTSLHLYAEVLPATATYKRVNWQILSGKDLATVNEAGVLTYSGNGENGMVRVQASTIDGSNIKVVKDISVSGFSQGSGNVPVSSIRISAPYTELTPSQNSVQLEVEILPADATEKGYYWDIISGIEVVEVSATGLVTAKGTDGSATVRVISIDGSGVYGEITITASGFGQSGVDNTIVTARIYTNNQTIYIENAEGLSIDMFDITGHHLKHVDKAAAQEIFYNLDTGVYLLCVEGRTYCKVLVE